MRTRISPRRALRIGARFATLFFLLAVALSLGFEAGAGYEWARQTVFVLGVAASLTAIAVVWLVMRSLTRSTHDAAKVSDRLDRVFEHVNAQISEKKLSP
jgi:Kef-type K+ transport system membrane component KefB